MENNKNDFFVFQHLVNLQLLLQLNSVNFQVQVNSAVPATDIF